MYRTGNVWGGLETLLVVRWLALVQLESLKASLASGDSWENRHPLSLGRRTGGGPGNLPRSSPCARCIFTWRPSQLIRRRGGEARMTSGVGLDRRPSGADQADVVVAPPSSPLWGNLAEVSPTSLSVPWRSEA